MLRLITAAACLCATIAQARSSDLSGEQINDLLAGATVEIDTPVGTRLPVRYGRDGKLFGRAGGLGWYLGAATDTGKWWVAGDQLCHRWSRWFDSVPQCLRLRKQGRILQWRTLAGHNGTATITMSPGPRVATVAPSTQPSPKKAAAPPETPPAPPKAPAPAGAPKHPPDEVAGDAGKAAPHAPAPAPAATEKDPVLPKPVLPQQQDEAPQKRAEPKRADGPLFKVAKVRSDDVLNVRSGPSADFDVVGALPPGSRGIAITSACRSQWCPVRHTTVSGWVNRAYLVREERSASLSALRDSPKAPRSCLTPAARALLERIEQQFGPIQVVSTCRPGSTIPGTWRPSRHASGNAVDFNAGSRKAEIVAWLIANHRGGGTMTYPGMDHIHVDIGPRFASIAGGPRWRSWRGDQAGLPEAR